MKHLFLCALGCLNLFGSMQEKATTLLALIDVQDHRGIQNFFTDLHDLDARDAQAFKHALIEQAALKYNLPSASTYTGSTSTIPRKYSEENLPLLNDRILPKV